MKFSLKVGQKDYEIEIIEKEEEIQIRVGEKVFSFQKEKRENEISFAKSSIPKRDLKKKEILAPIAGTISEIFVKEGDFVKKGQRLITLAAMKMENEILADFEGKIKKILVKKGENVKRGEILIIGE
jgi:biotin carboxyl carrier protein